MIIGIDASRAVTAQRTGTEAYAFFLIEALIPLAVRRGHRLRLYFNQPPPPQLFPDHTHVEQVDIPFSRLWTHVRLAAELHRRPPDVFFTPAHVIPVSYRGRSVATVHDLGYHYFPEAHTRRQLAYLKWSTRHNGRRSHTIIADSQATKRDLSHFYSTDPAKIQVVYPGVDPQLKRVTDEGVLTAVSQKYHITPPYLLHIGTLQPRKNLLRLVQAHQASRVPHQLVLAGRTGWLIGEQLSVISKQSSVNSHQSSVVTPGFVDDGDKAALISGATAVLYPSLHEGFGFPALEAQSCGVPLLCANTSSLPEVAGPGGALFIDPLDANGISHAIQQIVQQEDLRDGLVQKGVENVKRFGWRETAVQILTLLENAPNTR